MSDIKIIIENAVCKVEAGAEIHELLRNTLKYRNESISYQYNKNLRKINRLKGSLESSRFSTNPGLEKELKRLEHQNRALYKKLVVYLYNKHTFPTGLLPRVKKTFEDRGIKYALSDTRKKPVLGSERLVPRNPLPPLRYYQKAAVRRLETAHRGVVVACTGSGKTLTIAKMIADLRVKSLIITPSKAITDMMAKTMINYFGKGKVDKLTTKTVKIKKPINVCNIQALVKIPYDKLQTIDAVFCDEHHHQGADTYLEVNLKHLKNTYYRFGFTATNFRAGGDDMALEAVLSETLYEYPSHQAIADGYLVKPEFKIIENYNNVNSNNYQRVYKEGVVFNKDRNNLIVGTFNSLSKKHSTLILVKQVEHGELLKELIPTAKFIHGQLKDSVRDKIMEDFRKGKERLIIGTSILGEGVDLPIADVLIMANGGKSPIQVMQNVGRVLRIHPGKEKAIIYDFADIGAPWLEDHAKERQKIYELYEVKDD